MVYGILALATAVVLLSLGPAARLWKLPLLNVADLGASFFRINLFLFGLNLLPPFRWMAAASFARGWPSGWNSARLRGGP